MGIGRNPQWNLFFCGDEPGKPHGRLPKKIAILAGARASRRKRHLFGITMKDRVASIEARSQFVIEDDVRMTSTHLISPKGETFGCIRQPLSNLIDLVLCERFR